MSKPSFQEPFLQNPSFLIQKQGKFPSYASNMNPQNQKSAPKPSFYTSTMPKPSEGGHEFLDATIVTHSSLVTEPIRQNAQDMKSVIQHLVLENFKLKACPFNIQHNHKSCPFYHNCKDKKRPGNFYTADICEYAEREETCPSGDLCQKSHNRVEQLYRADKYKTKFCSFYPNYLEKCEYGIFCSFAHNENDILVELIHNLVYDDDFFMFKYKTVWCPFNLTQHDKSLCVYAHNWQDYRRSPHMYHYEPNPCSNWKSNDFVINYNEGCNNNFACSKCHGWKEHEFHPLNYKIKLCPAGKNCTKGRDCSYYHNEVDRRVLSQEIAYNVFKYFPKNRIITNTFKTLINEQNNITINNDVSGEIILTNVNNPWEKREMILNLQNDNINSLTDSNLLNLYDNVDRRESNDSANTERIKPSFSLTNLDKYMIQNNQKMKQDESSNQMFSRQDIVYPNETWNQKKASPNPPSKYMMAFSQPLFESKPESNPNQFINIDENEPQISSNVVNRPFNQTPSHNPNNIKPANIPLNFGIAAPPNLKKINPTPPSSKMAAKSQLNNTPNVMNQINQVRAPQNTQMNMPQMKSNQGSLTFNDNFVNSINSMKNAKSANFNNSYVEQPHQQIQMSFPQMKSPNQKTYKSQQPQSNFLPQNVNNMPQHMMFFNNNVNIVNENPMMMDRESSENRNQKFSMNSINKAQKEMDKPHFNLNINSQPFTVSYSFNYTPNQGMNVRAETENFDQKTKSKIGIWTNMETNSLHKANSQINLSKKYGSAEFDYEGKQNKSEENSPLLPQHEETKPNSQKLDRELEKNLSMEREHENYSEAQINNILKNICEEEYEDKN